MPCPSNSSMTGTGNRRPITTPHPARDAALWQALESRRAKFVELGSGEGALVENARRRGWSAIGMEISKVAIDRARERYPAASYVRHSIDSVDWPRDLHGADVVVAFEVIEHVFSPRALVQGAYGFMRPGGVLALSTPY